MTDLGNTADRHGGDFFLHVGLMAAGSQWSRGGFQVNEVAARGTSILGQGSRPRYRRRCREPRGTSSPGAAGVSTAQRVAVAGELEPREPRRAHVAIRSLLRDSRPPSQPRLVHITSVLQMQKARLREARLFSRSSWKRAGRPGLQTSTNVR